MSPATLIAFAGLPGTGKTTIAHELARKIGAVYLRIDTIEQALRTARRFTGDMEDEGYRIAYALAEDNLRQGKSVVTDAVNPLTLTRDAFAEAAKRAGAHLLEVEIVCTNLEEHRRRIETRTTNVPGLKLPTWTDVTTRHYEPWTRERLAIDTATSNADAAVALIMASLHSLKPRHA